MDLVYDNIYQVLKEGSPPVLLGKDGDVKHVGIRKDNPAFITDQIPIREWRVPVERLDNGLLESSHKSHHLLQAPSLILREGLGRKDVHRSCISIPLQLVQNRYLIDQRLARACGSSNDDMMTIM